MPINTDENISDETNNEIGNDDTEVNNSIMDMTPPVSKEQNSIARMSLRAWVSPENEEYSIQGQSPRIEMHMAEFV